MFVLCDQLFIFTIPLDTLIRRLSYVNIFPVPLGSVRLWDANKFPFLLRDKYFVICIFCICLSLGFYFTFEFNIISVKK